MVTGRDLKLPAEVTCEVCGETMDGSEPYWVTDHPRVVHERCRDWSRVDWPYAAQQRALCRIARELRQRWRVVADARHLLESVRRGWPQSAHLLPQCREAIERIEAMGSLPRIDRR